MRKRRISNNKNLRAYVTGVALGDGNLSNPNGRAVRLRITYDKKYPELAEFFKESIEKLLPDNRVSYVQRAEKYADISCFSNYWEKLLGWRVGKGGKVRQNVGVPKWIFNNSSYTRHCLRGLLQTDGSFYLDRGYPMINFVNHSSRLAKDVDRMMHSLGYFPHLQRINSKSGVKYTVRLSKNVDDLVKNIDYWKF